LKYGGVDTVVGAGSSWSLGGLAFGCAAAGAVIADVFTPDSNVLL
jgi:hypothetical protein